MINIQRYCLLETNSLIEIEYWDEYVESVEAHGWLISPYDDHIDTNFSYGLSHEGSILFSIYDIKINFEA